MKLRLMAMMMLLAAGAASLSGCAARAARCTGDTDTPQHHYLAGMKALESGDTAAAQKKLERSLYCNEEFAPGHSGMAIVHAEKAKVQTDAAFRQAEAARSGESLKRGRSFADTPADYFEYHLAGIRSLNAMKPKGWLDDADGHFRDAVSLRVADRDLPYYQGIEAAQYFMGSALLEGYEFGRSREMFAAVLNAKRDGKWHELADVSWRRANRIEQALAGMTVGDAGKRIAVKDSVSRADLAALLIDQLKIGSLMAGRLGDPAAEAHLAEFVPADVVAHPYRQEVLTLMKWRIRGIEPRYDETTKAYLFMPDEAVSRGELALVLEDVLLRIVGNEKLATAYYSQDNSPFSDVRSSSPLFNAVTIMTARGIMSGDLQGRFHPNRPVSGADALLAVRTLQQKLNFN